MNGLNYALSFMYILFPVVIAFGFTGMLAETGSYMTITEKTLVSLGLMLSGIGLSFVLAWKVSRAVARFEIRLSLVEEMLRERFGKDTVSHLEDNQ